MSLIILCEYSIYDFFPFADFIKDLIIAIITALFAYFLVLNKLNKEKNDGVYLLTGIIIRYMLNLSSIIDFNNNHNLKHDELSAKKYLRELEGINKVLEELLKNTYMKKVLKHKPDLNALYTNLTHEIVECKNRIEENQQQMSAISVATFYSFKKIMEKILDEIPVSYVKNNAILKDVLVNMNKIDGFINNQQNR